MSTPTDPRLFTTHHDAAVAQLVARLPGLMDGTGWSTVAQATDLAESTCINVKGISFMDMTRRARYAAVRTACQRLYRLGTFSRCLGDNAGREVRVYSVKGGMSR